MSNWNLQQQWVSAVAKADIELLIKLFEGEIPDDPDFDIEYHLERCEMWEERHWLAAMEKFGPRWHYFGNLFFLIKDRARKRATFGIQRSSFNEVAQAHVNALAGYWGLVLLWVRYRVPGGRALVGLRPMRLVLRALW